MIKNNLNILFVTGSLYQKSSGPFLSLFETAMTMQHKKYSPVVVGSKDRWSQGRSLDWESISSKAFKKIGPYSFHFTPGLYRWLANNKISFDVISLQSVWQYNNNIVARWCKKHKVPYMLTAHGNFNQTALKYSQWKKALAKKLFVNKMLQNAKVIHALNVVEYKAIRSFGIKSPVCIIPNGILLPDEGKKKSLLKDEFVNNVLKDKKICLFLGRLHSIKNIENLITAWARLNPLTNAWKLILAGPDDTGYMPVLERLIADLDLKDKIYFAGPQYGNDKAAWFQAADFFVLPSLSEGFAMTPLEAMSYKLPVLLTNTCNFNELKSIGAGIETGTSVDELAVGLRMIMSMSDSERKLMGENGYRLVKEKYQWDTIADQLIDVYQWMAGRTDAPSTVNFD